MLENLSKYPKLANWPLFTKLFAKNMRYVERFIIFCITIILARVVRTCPTEGIRMKESKYFVIFKNICKIPIDPHTSLP